jgi:hypothetical protein
MIPHCVGIWNKDVTELEKSKRISNLSLDDREMGLRKFSWMIAALHCCVAQTSSGISSSSEFPDYAHQIHSPYKVNRFIQGW